MPLGARLKLGAVLVGTAAVLLIFREKILSGYDPANFVLSLKYGYNVFQQRPHAPGYPAFYLIWQLVAIVTKWSPLLVIEIVNLLFVIIAICGTYYAAQKLFEERSAILCAVMVATNPVLLYYGCTAEISVFDAALGAMLLVMLLHPPAYLELALYLGFGISGSFRLSSFLLTLPIVLLVAFYKYRKNIWSLKKFWTVQVVIYIGVLMWLVPFIIYLGGWNKFWEILEDAASLPTTLVQNLSTFIIAMFWMFNIVLIGMAVYWKRLMQMFRAQPHVYFVLFALIGLPAIFFAFKYYAKGYALIYLPAAVLLITGLIRDRKINWVARSWIALNLLLFFAFPFLAPPSSVAMMPSNRNLKERTQDVLSRSVSVFSPTLAHLQINKESMRSAMKLVDSVPIGGTVILDNEAAFWAYPRSLQAMRGDVKFLLVVKNSKTLREYYADSLIENKAWPINNDIYYLTGADRVLPGSIAESRNAWKNNKLILFEFPRNFADNLRRYLDTLN